MTKIEFVVPGDPKPLQRARKGKWGFYDPAENLKAKSAVAWQARKAMAFHTAFDGPLKLTLIACHSWPSSMSKRKRKACNGHLKATRPDLDNYIKLCMDALNGVAYLDDGQVCEIVARKIFVDHEPCLRVILEPFITD